MGESLKLYAGLVLAYLGIVAPLFVILLSIFREGSRQLADQYEKEKTATEQNIREQLQKDIKIEDIATALRKLRQNKRKAASRLKYLNPKEQLIRLFLPPLISFFALSAFFFPSVNVWGFKVLLLSVSICAFLYAIYELSMLLSVTVEAIEKIDDEKRVTNQKALQLLAALVEVAQKNAEIFLEKVYLKLGDKIVSKDGDEITLPVDKKVELKASIVNSDERLAKNVEAGIMFPSQFIIEKPANGKLYIDEDGNQIVRFEGEMIHGNTALQTGKLAVTPLKKADYELRTWIKGENIKTIIRKVKLVVE